MKKMLILLLAAASLILMTGCVTETTVTEFDKDGKVSKKTVLERSTGDRVADVLGRSEGSWIIIRTGWAAYFSVAMATTEDPTPTGKGHIGSTNFVAAKVTSTQVNAGDVAKAQAQMIGYAFKDLQVSLDGAGSSTPEPSPSVETPTYPLSTVAEIEAAKEAGTTAK